MVNLRTFDLNLLRIFEALVQDQSVSRAADRLGLSQPAVSNALNRMRQQMDDPLFVRTHNGMEATPKAEQLATALLQGLTMIRAGLAAGTDFEPATAKRSFNLLMTDVGEIAFLPRVLATLKQSAPYIDLNVAEQGQERYGELLEAGMADLAIGRLDLPGTLTSQYIHTASYVVMVSRANPHLKQSASGKAFMSLEDYLSAPHVHVRSRGASGDPVAEALSENVMKRRIALSIPHATALPLIIGNTDLIATVAKACADYMVYPGLCYVEPPFPIPEAAIHQWWHKRNTNDPGHRWLRQTFADAAAWAPQGDLPPSNA